MIPLLLLVGDGNDARTPAASLGTVVGAAGDDCKVRASANAFCTSATTVAIVTMIYAAS